jgi:hypothetical protein
VLQFYRISALSAGGRWASIFCFPKFGSKSPLGIESSLDIIIIQKFASKIKHFSISAQQAMRHTSLEAGIEFAAHLHTSNYQSGINLDF